METQSRLPNFKLLKVLGRGACGPVYLAKDSDRLNKYFAIKTLNKPKDSILPVQEVEILKKLKNYPGIIKLDSIVDLNDHILMVLEYCNNGDLYDFIANYNYDLRLSQEGLYHFNITIKNLFLSILRTIKICHINSIYHRDIKPENILLNDDSIRLADFGLATTAKYSKQFGCGSGYYMAPEIQRSNMEATVKKHGPYVYSCQKADIWSLGILFLNLCSGQNPWETATLDDRNFLEFMHRPNLLKQLFPLTEAAYQIALTMLKVNPSSRLNVDDIIELVEQCDQFVIHEESNNLNILKKEASSKISIDSVSSCNMSEATLRASGSELSCTSSSNSSEATIETNTELPSKSYTSSVTSVRDEDSLTMLAQEPYLYLSLFT